MSANLLFCLEPSNDAADTRRLTRRKDVRKAENEDNVEIPREKSFSEEFARHYWTSFFTCLINAAITGDVGPGTFTATRSS